MTQYIKPDGITGLNSGHALNGNIHAFLEIGQTDKELVGDVTLTSTATYIDDTDIGDSRFFDATADKIDQTVSSIDEFSVLIVYTPIGDLAGGNNADVNYASLDLDSGNKWSMKHTGFNSGQFDIMYRGSFGTERRLQTLSIYDDSTDYHQGHTAVQTYSLLGTMTTTLNGVTQAVTNTQTTSALSGSPVIEFMTSLGVNASVNVAAIVIFDKVLSNAEAISVSNDPWALVSSAADIVAPILSSPTGLKTGSTTATGTVTTDEANGTLYYLATTNSSESAATIKAGGNQSVSATGVQNVSLTGLSAGTIYYLHYVHDDAATNESNVVSSTSFTTDGAVFTIDSVTTITPKTADNIVANLSSGVGPYTATYKGQSISIFSQTSSTVTFIWEDLGALGDFSALYETAYDLIITDTSNANTDTVSMTTSVETGAEFGQITQIGTGGLYANDNDVQIGDYSYIFDITGDVEIQVETGLFSNNLPSTAKYRLYRTNWSDPAANSVFAGIPIPTIDINPTDGSVTVGDSQSVKTFSVIASDITGELTYQWEFSDDAGSNYNDVVGATAFELDVGGDEFVDTANTGRLYRCVVSNVGGFITSNFATLTLSTAALPIILVQPQDGIVQATNVSSQHTFSIISTGATSFQWEFSDNGIDYNSVAGGTSNSLIVTGGSFVDIANSGRLYRCRAINNSGTTISNTATLVITEAAQTAPVITSQPSSGQVQAQNDVSSHGFVVVATNANSFQWEISDNSGSSFNDIVGATSSTLVVTGDEFVDDLLSGRLYRCKITNNIGTTISSNATLTITPAAVSETAFTIDASNPVVDCDDILVTHTYAIWELRDKPMWDPTNVIIDSGVSFSVVSGVGSIPTPNAVLNTNYEFSARDAGDNPSNLIRTIGMVI